MPAPRDDSHTIVLGAGLQGVCTALALSRAGRRVTIVDREPECMLRASLSNEGKVHLGFVYAHDLTGRTPSLMLESALAFGPLLEEWIGAPVPWARYAAAPFSYLILRDTLVPAEQLFDAWRQLECEYGRVRQRGSASYLGTSPSRLWWPVETSDPLHAQLGDRVAHALHTSELAVEMQTFRTLIRARLAADGRIRCLFGHDVREVERVPNGFRVTGATGDGASWTERAETVVNCLWEGRLAIDRQLGVLPRRPWVHRLKCRLLGRLPPRLMTLPSLTLMCGRFGDIVNYGDGRAYLSWYPACLRGWSSDVEVPEDWQRISRGELGAEERGEIIGETLEAFDAIVPGFKGCAIDSIAGGVIFSWGRTDIDDLDSELHRRDDIGPTAHDGYITVNTGKITSAPLFAKRVAELIVQSKP